MNNLDAFLTMIAVSEGTQQLGDRGYNVIVGSTPNHPILFDSYADHPRRVIQLRPGLSSSAAGRYQILESMFDAYKARLHLKDFSPEAQNAIATQMIRERGALPDIEAGRIAAAVERCTSIWASLPGNNYRQHQNTLAALQAVFQSAGGRMVAA